MSTKKQESEEPDLSYMKSIKRQVTLKKDDPVDELDDLFDEIGISKT